MASGGHGARRRSPFTGITPLKFVLDSTMAAAT